MSSPEEISLRYPTVESVKRTKHNFRASPNFSNTLLNTPPPPFQSIPPPPQVAAVANAVDTWNNVIDHDYFNSFPPGYRFNPSDEELILRYLNPKVNNQTLPKHRIVEVNVYQHNPEDLADEYKECGEGGWYFFTPRDRKYKNGFRPKRAAGNGYWKATGGDKELKSRDKIIGYRRSLVFYVGKAPKGDKTNWIMHEYRVNTPPTPANKRSHNDMRLDDWVLCRIYKKTDKNNNTRTYRKKDVDADAAAAQLYSHSFYGLAIGIPDPYLLEPDNKPGSPDHYYSFLASFPLVDMPRPANSASYGQPSE